MINKLRLLLLTLFVSFALVFTGCNMGQKQEDPNPNGTEQNETDKTDESEKKDETEKEPEDVPPVNSDDPYLNLTSVQMAKKMTIGWNLGNTLDAHYNGGSGLGIETSWGMPKTTQAMIKGIKAAGFKTIRIPVSWHNHVDPETLVIDSAWMDRVKTVVDWALDEGLVVILNVHHDESAADATNAYTYAVSQDADIQAASKKYITEMWKQISATFKDYGNNLVFELLNEPRKIGEADEWNISGDAAIKANTVITAYEQAALDTIRASGGKNATRFLMAPGYAASPFNLEGYVLPTDSATGRMILSVHAYSPYNFAMGVPGDTEFTDAHKTELSNLFNNLETNYISKGYGVVIGETGATNKNNDEARNAWAAYYFGEAYKKGMPAVLWDNGIKSSADNNEAYGYYNRSSQTWYSPDLIKAAMDAVGVTGYSIPASE